MNACMHAHQPIPKKMRLKMLVEIQIEILDCQISRLFSNEPFERRPVMTIDDFVLHSDDHFESHLFVNGVSHDFFFCLCVCVPVSCVCVCVYVCDVCIHIIDVYPYEHTCIHARAQIWAQVHNSCVHAFTHGLCSCAHVFVCPYVHKCCVCVCIGVCVCV